MHTGKGEHLAIMSPTSIIAKIVQGNGPEGEIRFTGSFTIGRSKECEFSVKEASVSRKQLAVEFDGACWWLKDLGSGNGSFLNGARISHVEISENAVVELGERGPQILLKLENAEAPKAAGSARFLDKPITETVEIRSSDLPKPGGYERPHFDTETQVIRHYLDKPKDEPAGEQTMIIRRAFSREHKAKSKKYQYLIGLAVLLLMVAGGFIQYQKQKLEKMRATAQDIFYMMKSQELQIVHLEDVVLLKADPQQVADLRAKQEKFKGMEREYDNFVKELGIYGKLSEEDKAIMKVARLFGECEVAMPSGFPDEVKRYIAMWKSSDRLNRALARAREKGYADLIMKVLNDNNLPPQYFYLALQESNFDEKAVGPPTRFGCAKGMWQFLAQTADGLGLKIGPLYDQGIYDPLDERFDTLKSTIAAMKYIRDLNVTYAQASGLLVLASYNWGDGNVRKTIGTMPENPRERNFWKLLATKQIPKETYDYVFLIFSAAVICENPKVFGYAGFCPVCTPPGLPAAPPAAAPVGKPL